MQVSNQKTWMRGKDILFQGYLNEHHGNFVLCFALIVLYVQSHNFKVIANDFNTKVIANDSSN